MAAGWRYFAQRLDGSGAAITIHPDLPLRDVALTSTLSGPDALTATITPEVAALVGDDGKPVFREWSTAVWAEKDGEIRGGGILAHTGIRDAALTLECVGVTGYLRSMPYTSSRFFVEADPLDIARHIWDHVQAQPAGNLGVTLDPTTSPVRIGTELKQVEFDTQEGPVSFEAGPYKLSWWQTHDLSDNFDQLAADTPFEYREDVHWGPDDRLRFHVRIGYPTIGARRTDLRFVIGENVSKVPDLEYPGDEYANEMIVLGAGEGSTMVRGQVARPHDRLRRVAVVQDKQRRSERAAVDLAKRELALRLGEFSVTDVVVRDHPHAKVGSWQTGDEIFVAGDAGWVEMGVWCRVLSTTISPEQPDVAAISIIRTDKVNL